MAQQKNARLDLAIAAVVLVGVFVPHYIPRSAVYDSLWSVHVSMSLLTEGDLDLDEYQSIAPPQHYALRRHDGHLYDAFPPGAPILTAPLVYLLDKAWPLLEETSLRKQLAESTRPTGGVQRLIASMLTAVTALLIYRIARRRLNRRRALVAVFVFAFCTSMWSTASRALWQHGPSVLMLTVALSVLLAAERRPWLVQFAALPLAISFVIRPTNAVAVATLSVCVFVKFRRWFLPYLAWGLGAAAAFVAMNLGTWGSLLPPYFQPSRLGGDHFFEALAGNLVSPARGLLIFSPVLALAAVGVARKLRRKTFTTLDAALVATVVLHWLAVSAYPHWWGGHSYGPRLMTDMVPYLLLLLLPALEPWPKCSRARRRAMAAAVVVLISWSAFVHHQGAIFHACYQWNATPADVDHAPQRLWDWSDPQFLRAITRHQA